MAQRPPDDARPREDALLEAERSHQRLKEEIMRLAERPISSSSGGAGGGAR